MGERGRPATGQVRRQPRADGLTTFSLRVLASDGRAALSAAAGRRSPRGGWWSASRAPAGQMETLPTAPKRLSAAGVQIQWRRLKSRYSARDTAPMSTSAKHSRTVMLDTGGPPSFCWQDRPESELATLFQHMARLAFPRFR